MTDREPIETTNLDRYGFRGAALEPAARHPRGRAASGRPPASSSARCGPTAGPTPPAIGAAWVDGDLYFMSSPTARKAAQPGRAQGLHDLRGGWRASTSSSRARRAGSATRPTLELLAAHYREGGWPAEVEGDAFTAPFSAPSAGPPPWHLYRFVFHTAFGVATAEPYGATRWRFGC